MSKAVELVQPSTINKENFRKKLNTDCYIIWSLPHFNETKLANTPFLYEHIDSIEKINLNLQAAYIDRSTFKS